MAGKISVHSIPVPSLFDSGMSHCYISSRFVHRHVVPSVRIKDVWEISIDSGIVTDRICKSCPIVICGRVMKADMFVLNTKGYNVIFSKT